MPELPEVETVKRGIQILSKQKITDLVIRNFSLRYPITKALITNTVNKTIVNITRKAKYLIIELNPSGYIILHLGMSGKLSLANKNTSLIKHDHVDFVFNEILLRYNDPRRFGCIIYTESLDDHPLLKNLGPEPLEDEFNDKYLLKQLAKKKSSIKQLIMDNHIVVGVGNIYACEALFLAKISPIRRGESITKSEAKRLTETIKEVLSLAIKLGGSSLRDYKKADGNLGYFQNVHNVYGKAGTECRICNSIILEKRLGQRNSFFCSTCQK